MTHERHRWDAWLGRLPCVNLILGLYERDVGRLMLSKEPPWYVKWFLVSAGVFLVSVAAWSLVAVLGWGLSWLSGL